MSSFLPRVPGATVIALLVAAGMASPADAAMSSRRAQVINCSSAELISAINAANTARQGTITIPSNCTISLTSAYVEATTRGPNGLPIIRENITITGGTNSIIERAVGSPAFRILEVACGGRLTLQNVIVQNGDSGANTGGAVLNARGTIVMSSSTVRNSTGDNGAGISNDTGSLSLDHTTVSGNTTSGGGAGGIYNDGTLKVTRGSITGNTANTSGGAIYNEQRGTVDLTSTTITGNQATLNHGGAIYNDDTAGQMTINDVNLQSNSASGMGGLIYNEATISLINSAVFYNTSGTEGGGIMNAATGSVSLVGGAIAFNTAGTTGGGIYNAAGGVVTRSGGVIAANTPNNCAPLGSVPGCTG